MRGITSTIVVALIGAGALCGCNRTSSVDGNVQLRPDGSVHDTSSGVATVPAARGSAVVGGPAEPSRGVASTTTYLPTLGTYIEIPAATPGTTAASPSVTPPVALPAPVRP